ncbi:MAG: o-succinylbenzoate synthase [Hormoscilla sp. GUM202]|nr:o-succinylbenzoate synthase [Hormoscilla sp. GUM202]
MHSRYQFEFRPYQRKFRRSLTTSHGSWNVRQGIIIRLTDATGKVGWGEIAPLPWFGSETCEQSLSFCENLPSEITSDIIKAIPDDLPACQFGFETPTLTGGATGTKPACAGLQEDSLTYSCLLPAGPESLQSWQGFWHQGYRTFKWKIGVIPIAEELKILAKLRKELPLGTKLRLDANGGLTWEESCQWLDACEGKAVEFMEQPLGVEKLEEMQELSEQYATPIALDESVATLDRLETCYHRGWRSIFVIKAAIAGSPSRLRQFCRSHPLDIVFSSVMETAIGRNAALKLAAELQTGNRCLRSSASSALRRHRRAVGFGVKQWFTENDDNWLKELWDNH